MLNQLSRHVVKSYTDRGPVPGAYSAGDVGITGMFEINKKEYFSLDLPKPSESYIGSLPNTEALLPLFERDDANPVTTNRVSLLLPFFAQHLTDAVFQSKEDFKTDAPHEIVLNQIYSNTAEGLQCLRSKERGKMKSRFIEVNGKRAEFPPQLCEQAKDGSWHIKQEFGALNYAKDPQKVASMLKRYKERETDLCAVGLYQGNFTMGNFALTTLLLREHNRLCDLIYDEFHKKGKPTDDESIFETATMVNIVTYMRVVVEDYINTFSGMKIFRFDTSSFFYEKKRWCRSSPIPFHFNILYRLHTMIPNQLDAMPEQGFSAFLASNDVVMNTGLGSIFEIASNQAASQVSLRNTHAMLLPSELAMLNKGRKVLASFADYRKLEGLSNSKGFELFDPKHRDKIKSLYDGDYSKVDYAVGIFAETPSTGLVEKIAVKMGKGESFLGDTLMTSIAKHAFRHIYSNPLMCREFLNPGMLSDVGWHSLQTTHSAEDLIKRNVPEMGDSATALDISMVAPQRR